MAIKSIFQSKVRLQHSFCEDNLVEESESKLDEWFLTKKC
jgi:hypothetical protein